MGKKARHCKNYDALEKIKRRTKIKNGFEHSIPKGTLYNLNGELVDKGVLLDYLLQAERRGEK